MDTHFGCMAEDDKWSRKKLPEAKPTASVDKGVIPRTRKRRQGVLQYTSLHTSCPTDLVTAWTGGPQVFCFPNGRFDDTWSFPAPHCVVPERV